MSAPQRVIISEIKYDSDMDLVTWVVELKNGQQAELVWLRKDFAQSALNLKYVIPQNMIEEFCERLQIMIGKEFNLIVGG